MQMSELTALRSRLLRAKLRGYGVARAAKYAKALGGSGSETSAAQLLALCEAKMAGKPAPKAAAPAAPPPAPEPSAPEMEMGDEEEVEPYEEWRKADLLAEAEARGIEGAGSMLKAELVSALYADDESDD